MAGTCQILQREDYLGVLEPWRDYIPLEADYSNMDEVLLAMKDLDKCQLIVENAKRALVESKFFDYSQLVKEATDGLLRSTKQVDSSAWDELSEFLSKAASTASKVNFELHDSSLYVIQEEILNWSASKFEKFVLSLNRRQLSKVAEEFQVSSSLMHVLYALENSDCLGWFVDSAISARGDTMSLRTAWIWRPITSEEESPI
jgi:hypothetical protein